MHWIVPQKLLAMSSPCKRQEDIMGNQQFTPQDYAKLFKKWGISLVIRLNSPLYSESVFERQGIRVVNLYFKDGSVPSEAIVSRFIKLVKRHRGPVAVHCRAGLGRTATLIGCYVMKHFGMNAETFIAWSRIVRRGSVHGPQQKFLCDI